MLKIPASTKAAWWRVALVTSFVSLIMLAGTFPSGQAQQSPDAARQQRPRRVNKPAPSNSPATRPTPVQATRGEEIDEDDVVRVDTELVSVPAIVTDGNGRPVTGLRADNFKIFEDGQPQQISNFATTDAPFEVALLLDTSGSTRGEVALIRRAANAFIDALRPGDRVAIVAFRTALEADTSLAAVEVKTDLTDDRKKLREAVETIGSSNGTPFYDGLEKVAQEIFRDPPGEQARGRRALVALTDGVDSTSSAEFAEVRGQLRRAGIICYFIEVNTEEFVEDRLMQDCADDGTLRLSRAQLQRYRKIFNPRSEASDYGDFCRLGPFERMHISRTLYTLARQEMSQLARDSGGKTFPVEDVRGARSAFAQVAADIGTQYSLGYYSTNKSRDGRFRQIRVEVRGVKGAQVRAREGYQSQRDYVETGSN